MNYSDSNDSEPDTGRFKSLKLKKNSSQYKSYVEHASDYQKRMLAEEKSNDHSRRVREECNKSRDSKKKHLEFKERMSDNGHKSSHKETLRAESKTKIISINPDVKRRRSRSIERNYRSESKNSNSDYSSYFNDNKSTHQNVSFGPALPPMETEANNADKHVGPVLPPGYNLNYHQSSLEDVIDEPKKNIGPQIPKHILDQTQVRTLGVDMIERDFDNVSSSEEEEVDCSFIIGPMPTGSKTLSAAQLELEKRALEIKIKKLDDARTGSTCKIDDEREEWMIELPGIRKVADFGLGARQFRTKERPDFDDRTQWTDTPQVKSISKRKEQKIDLQKEQKKLLQTARDQEQDRIATIHKKKNKRDSSLMEIHKKKLKKEKEKKDIAVGRRPFDRDLDLQSNRFDESRNKATVRKAALLDTRFASSKQGKYL
ncbi:unnamed protein product [Diamesa hyperborea]